ncbi:PucR family transcriptional regulator [Niallia sp. Krafla_26]|uniref:PucR family transcriptional regulator n=1 Tax=Niallia sp. Krafla_26 TaxID=3064703 RepID=UPI003D16C778
MVFKNLFHTNISNLEELADVISQLLHCPVTIEDANHKLLSYSTHHGVTDPARTSTIIERRVPEKVINRLWKDGTIPHLLSHTEPLYIPTIDDVGLGNRMAISIWHNNEVLGFIWALEMNKAFGQEDKEILQQAAIEAKNIFLKNKIKNSKKEEHVQEFFWKILTKHFHSKKVIQEKFQELKLSIPTIYSITIFQFNEDITDKTEKNINYLLNTIQFPKVIMYTVDQNKLLCLTSLEDSKSSIDLLNKFCHSFITNMHERYGVKPIVQAISGIHRDLLEMEQAYKEALLVLSMKEKFPSDAGHINSYQNLGYYRYLDELIKANKENHYENHVLQKLHEYDVKYNNDLVQTLEVYLNKDSNVICAAKELNIHPNTLSYRLKRISEIGEVDLKDITQKVTLFLDLKLRKFT